MMRRIPRLIVSLAIPLCVVLPVRSERLPIKIYSSADGLGSSFIDFLMRDSRGFMWFCTRDGLSRFDGARFITYRVGDRNAPPGIESIYETRDGTYWITTTAGLYRFRPGASPQPDKTIGDRPFLNAEAVNVGRGPLLEDSAGNLWYASNDLYRMKEINGKFQLEPVHLRVPASSARPLDIFQIREAPDGCLWLNSNQGLIRRFPDGRLTLYHHETPITIGLASVVIQATGRVWVIWRNDFYVINPAALESVPKEPGVIVKQLVPDSTAPANPGARLNLPGKPDEIVQLKEYTPNPLTGRLYESSDRHVWLIADETLLEFDGQAFHVYGSKQGLPAGMGEMAEDSAGNLWIGGRVALVRLNRKGLVTFREEDGLASKNIQSITQDQQGNLYFVNGNYGVSRFDGQRFQTTRVGVADDARALWTSRAAVLTDTNEWWALTSTKLYHFSAGNLSQPIETFDSHNQFKADEMFQMFEDSHGDIWISQQPGRLEDFGLYRLKKGEKSFHRFTKEDGLPEGKAAGSFAEDRKGNLWFGFYEGGLVRFANERFTLFTANDGLPAGLITDLLLDTKGRLWMTSTNGGVRRIDDPGAAKPAFIPLTTDQNLASNNTRTITEDKSGNIYVGTVRGVDQISADLTRIRHYSVADGLAGDFVVDSHCDSNGAMWFATTNGLSRMVPAAGEIHPAPPVRLGGLRIAGEQRPISELGDIEVSKGELAHTQNNFQIEFFALDFHAGETLRYQFMLEGADSAWSAPTEQRTVNYANLRPGAYRFLVRAVNSDGIVSERPAVLSFTILPPLWLRWWFITLAVLLTLALFYLFYRYRMAHLREVNAALSEAKRAEEGLGRAREERLVELARVRTRIATDLHDDIGASLTQIAILSEVAKQQSANGGAIAPLESIAQVSNELVESMSDIVWAINPKKDHLQDLIQRMRRFASDVLTARGISLRFKAPSFATDIPLGANPRRDLLLIFKESLTNIVKHANASHVRIEFAVSREILTLVIADDGSGFDVGRIQDSLFSDQKGGHGILSMKKRAVEMAGEFSITSAPGRGSTVKFQLPLQPAESAAVGAATQMGGDIDTSDALN